MFKIKEISTNQYINKFKEKNKTTGNNMALDKI